MLKADDLVGAWRLLVWQIDYPDGRSTVYPFGRDAEGLIVYSGDGFMSAVLQRAGRAGLTGEQPVRLAQAREKAALFDSYMHYAGPYRIDGADVVHQVRFALNTDLLDTEQRRHVRFEDGILHLSGVEKQAGKPGSRTHRLQWQRAAT